VLADLSVRGNRAAWVAATYITDDTEALSAEAQERLNVATQRFALAARRFDRAALPADVRRKLTLLKLALVAPPPSDPRLATELTQLGVGLEASYGRGKYCRAGALGRPAGAPGDTTCYAINELSRALAESRDPAVLLDAWQGWHRVGAPMRQRYARFAELSNAGARELGFADAGAMWRSNYDMPADRSPRSWSGCGSRCGRCTRRCTRTCAAPQPAVRRRRRAEERAHPGAPARQHVGAGVGERVPAVAPPNAAPTYDLTALLAPRASTSAAW
jgi:peptidyl-dipeptidase A